MSNAAQTSIQNSNHSDLITSLSFDLFGTRLATSSLDHTIRVTSLSTSTGLWDSNLSDFKAHDSPVLKVVWGHPEFGTLLASGGVDGMVKIWTEEESTIRSSGHNNNNNNNNNNQNTTSTPSNATTSNSKRWVQRVALTDCRGTIRDIEFSPPEFGLKLACISSDSHLRVWECLDPISFADWSLIEDIDLSSLPLSVSTGQPGSGGSSGGGNVPRNSSSIALATVGGINSSSVKGFEVGASPAKGSGSINGGVGIPSTSLGSASTTTSGSGSNGQFDRKSGTVESDGGWSLSWCKESWWGERLAVSAGASGIIRLFHLPDHAPWTNFANLLPPRPSSSFSQPAPVSSLAWAPASGRSYQLLASGSRDGRARIWKLFPPSLANPTTTSGVASVTGGGGGLEEKWTTEMDAELEEGGKRNGGGSVGNVKVDWNLTGTVVSTAGEDAQVRLWKSNYVGQWKSIALLSTEESDESMSTSGK